MGDGSAIAVTAQNPETGGDAKSPRSLKTTRTKMLSSGSSSRSLNSVRAAMVSMAIWLAALVAPTYLAKMVAITVTFAWNFTVLRLWVWPS